MVAGELQPGPQCPRGDLAPRGWCLPTQRVPPIGAGSTPRQDGGCAASPTHAGWSHESLIPPVLPILASQPPKCNSHVLG